MQAGKRRRSLLLPEEKALNKDKTVKARGYPVGTHLHGLPWWGLDLGKSKKVDITKMCWFWVLLWKNDS